jgi:NADPH:quinone reductase-like Zn-dependent oxidoreductase
MASLRLSYIDHPQWSTNVLAVTDERGVDLVVELGGTPTIRESLRSLAVGGRIAAIGGLGGWNYESVDPLQLITKMTTVHGVYVGSKKSLHDLLSFVAEHEIEPYISARFPLRDAPAAYRLLEDGRHVGKIVIDLA